MPASASPDDRAARIAAHVNRDRHAKTVGSYAPARPDLLTPEQCRAWEDDGFFLLRGLVPKELCAEINADVIARVRHMAAHGHEIDALRVSGASFTTAEENSFTMSTSPKTRSRSSTISTAKRPIGHSRAAPTSRC